MTTINTSSSPLQPSQSHSVGVIFNNLGSTLDDQHQSYLGSIQTAIDAALTSCSGSEVPLAELPQTVWGLERVRNLAEIRFNGTPCLVSINVVKAKVEFLVSELNGQNVLSRGETFPKLSAVVNDGSPTMQAVATLPAIPVGDQPATAMANSASAQEPSSAASHAPSSLAAPPSPQSTLAQSSRLLVPIDQLRLLGLEAGGGSIKKSLVSDISSLDQAIVAVRTAILGSELVGDENRYERFLATLRHLGGAQAAYFLEDIIDQTEMPKKDVQNDFTECQRHSLLPSSQVIKGAYSSLFAMGACGGSQKAPTFRLTTPQECRDAFIAVFSSTFESVRADKDRAYGGPRVWTRLARLNPDLTLSAQRDISFLFEDKLLRLPEESTTITCTNWPAAIIERSSDRPNFDCNPFDREFTLTIEPQDRRRGIVVATASCFPEGVGCDDDWEVATAFIHRILRHHYGRDELKKLYDAGKRDARE